MGQILARHKKAAMRGKAPSSFALAACQGFMNDEILATVVCIFTGLRGYCSTIIMVTQVKHSLITLTKGFTYMRISELNPGNEGFFSWVLIADVDVFFS